MPITYTFNPTPTSCYLNGATVIYNSTVLVVGGASGANNNAMLRFDTSTIVPTAIVVQAALAVKVASVQLGTLPTIVQNGPPTGTPSNIVLWASAFGTVIDNGDYNLPSSNSDPVRVQLNPLTNPILLSTATQGQTGSSIIPARFVARGAGLFSDFELRPAIQTLNAIDALVICGPTATLTADKPTLTVTTITIPENDAQSAYRFQAVGAESYVAFDIETTPGVAVKSKVMLDYRSTTLDSYAENLAGQSNNAQRIRPRKIALGRAGGGGDVDIELTPEKCWKLLLGMMNITGTVNNGDGTYTHTLGVAPLSGVPTFTFARKLGAFRFVYPGSMISKFDIKASLDSIVTSNVSVMCRDEWMYDYTATGVNDEQILSSTAAYDTVANAVLSYIGGSVSFNGVTDRGLVQNFDLTIAQDVRERRGLSGQRQVTSHFALGFMADIKFSMYFENENRLRDFLGIGNTDFPNRASKNIEFENLVFTLTGQGAKQIFTFTMPKVMYTVVRKPVQGEGEVMLDCSGVAAFDDGTGTNLVVTVQTTEPASAYAASTDLITVLPAGV